MSFARGVRWLALLVAVLPAWEASAHKLSDSYLTLRPSARGLDGEWHLALRDLEDAVGLDLNEDGVITWKELQARREIVTDYARSRLHLSAGSNEYRLLMSGFLVDHLSDGAYAVLRFAVEETDPTAPWTLEYQALFDIDPSHRGLVKLDGPTGSNMLVFGPQTTRQRLEFGSSSMKPSLQAFVREGVWHIWTGYDHVLFLLALLLPGVLRRGERGWEPVDRPRRAFANVLKIVTAFTIAHSITLSLAALGWVRLPPRLVESAIAASVVIAAMNNVFPVFSERGWMVAFGFGLIHGFGFANALSDIGLHRGELAVTLFGFNFGVELGQLAIVCVLLPAAILMRRWRIYETVVLRTGSLAIATISAAWLAERVFDCKWLPF